MDLYQRTQKLLGDLTVALQHHQLWSVTQPSVEALQSRAPFCVDTMAFETWLQFVFLPRMHALVDGRLPLPSTMQIAPMAEVAFEGRNVSSLLQVLTALDTLLNQS